MVAVKKAHVAGQITTGSFAKLLGAYAEDQTLQHNATLAYMGVTPPVDLTMRGIKNHTNALLTKNNDFSAYVSVIASEVGITLPVTGATYWTNGATHYAALVSQLRPESAPTNKIVKGVKGIRFGFSVRQLNSLNQKKFVTFTLDEGNMRVVEGKTTAPEIQYGDQVIASNYTQLSTLRITQTAIEVVRQAAKPFIGEPNQMPQYNALNAAIKGALEGMRSAGALQDYQFSVTAVSAKLDSAKITLSIVPMFELRRISVDVSLRPPTNVTL
jgi:aspartate 1-decarboxylase